VRKHRDFSIWNPAPIPLGRGFDFGSNGQRQKKVETSQFRRDSLRLLASLAGEANGATGSL
jgi:hypothetical protein